MNLNASVIIPTYNNCTELEKCLACILDQTLSSSEYEVIVVDDGSTDGTANMIQALAAPNLQYFFQENSGRAKARNHGILNATGKIILFIDSDVLVCHHFVEMHLQSHTSSNHLMIRGITFNIPAAGFEKKADILSSLSSASFPTHNCSVRKDWLVEAGLFNEDFTQYGWEDLELSRRLQGLGLRKATAHKAIAYHIKPPLKGKNFLVQLQKEKERGRMSVVYFQKHPTFRTRASTLYILPLMMLHQLLALGNWTQHPNLLQFTASLEQKGLSLLWRIMTGILLTSSYFSGMEEAHGLRMMQKNSKGIKKTW